MRTIVLRRDESIKAVIGKAKGEDSMEIESYLFQLDKGWTVDKAKAGFEKHHHQNEVLRAR